MKARTIKKVINTKINNWLDSIENETLREECRNNLIVTGGSIASMLLGQDVNDYDIYFKTKEVARKISEYYVNQINSIYLNNISNSVIEVVDSNKVPKKDYEQVEWETQWSFFKEGLLRNNEERIKLYIPHVGYWRKTDERASKEIELPKEETYKVVYLTENAITLSDDIQLVIRFFGDVEEIHKNYDFAHATSYFHFNNNKAELVLRPKAMEALLTQELIYIGSKYPLTSIIRTKKFINRGYTITAGTYLKILWQVAELDLKDPIVLQEQLMGVDVAYFSLLIEALTGIDPEKLTYNYISTIIDKVFNDWEESEQNS